MNRTLAVLLILACGTAHAQPVRVIAPASHPMQVAAPQDGATKRSAAELKPAIAETPSPILVDRVARVRADGTLDFGCGNRALPDLRRLTRVQPTGAQQ